MQLSSPPAPSAVPGEERQRPAPDQTPEADVAISPWQAHVSISASYLSMYL